MIDAMVRKVDELWANRHISDEVCADLRATLLAGKEEQPKEIKNYDEVIISLSNRVVDIESCLHRWQEKIDSVVLDENGVPKVKELKIGGYQTLALRIEESNERISFLEADRGKRLTEIEKRVNDLWYTVANVVKRMEDYDAKDRPVALDSPEDYSDEADPQSDGEPIGKLSPASDLTDEEITEVYQGKTSPEADKSCHICGFRGGMHHNICSATRTPMKGTTGKPSPASETLLTLEEKVLKLIRTYSDPPLAPSDEYDFAIDVIDLIRKHLEVKK